MQYFILDTNIVLRDLSVLAKSSQEIRIILPEAVVLELTARTLRSKSSRRTLDFIEEAYAQGVVRINIRVPRQ